jgi:hypothetical protein
MNYLKISTMKLVKNGFEQNFLAKKHSNQKNLSSNQQKYPRVLPVYNILTTTLPTVVIIAFDTATAFRTIFMINE